MRSRLPVDGRTVESLTDSARLEDALSKTFPTGEDDPQNVLIYLVDAPCPSALPSDLLDFEGATICAPDVRIQVVRGPEHAGFFTTCVKASVFCAGAGGPYPAHAAVLSDGTAIVGAAGMGKTTLAMMLAVDEGLSLVTEDWSYWTRQGQETWAEAGGPMGISRDLYEHVDHRLPREVRSAAEEHLKKRPSARVPLRLLFPDRPSAVAIRRVILTTMIPDGDPVEQLARSNYHVPFVFPFGQETERSRCISRSLSSAPFFAQEQWVTALWRDLLDRVPLLVVDRNAPVGDNLERVRTWRARRGHREESGTSQGLA